MIPKLSNNVGMAAGLQLPFPIRLSGSPSRAPVSIGHRYEPRGLPVVGSGARRVSVLVVAGDGFLELQSQIVLSITELLQEVGELRWGPAKSASVQLPSTIPKVRRLLYRLIWQTGPSAKPVMVWSRGDGATWPGRATPITNAAWHISANICGCSIRQLCFSDRLLSATSSSRDTVAHGNDEAGLETLLGSVDQEPPTQSRRRTWWPFRPKL